MKFKLTSSLSAILFVTTFASTNALADEVNKERDPREFSYLQLAGGLALSSSAGINVGLGSQVNVPGRAYYDKGNQWGITLGYQFLRDEDKKDKQGTQLAQTSESTKQEERQPMRAEVEFLNAAVVRSTIILAAETVHPLDKVKPRVVFFNLSVPVAESEELYPPEDPKRKPEPLWRTWLGAGIGYANVKYGNASAISGCNCLREASGNGLAFQLKLQAERQIDENTYLFAQVGRVWLPGVTTSNSTQSTNYKRWGLNNISIGLRWHFR